MLKAWKEEKLVFFVECCPICPGCLSCPVASLGYPAPSSFVETILALNGSLGSSGPIPFWELSCRGWAKYFTHIDMFARQRACGWYLGKFSNWPYTLCSTSKFSSWGVLLIYIYIYINTTECDTGPIFRKRVVPWGNFGDKGQHLFYVFLAYRHY